MTEKSKRLKTWIFAAIVVLSNAFGNLFLDFGVHGSYHVRALGVEMDLGPWLVPGILLLILWMLSRMALLSWADLSFVLPVTAVGYVFSAAFGWLFLHEQISNKRWIGALLISAGVMLVGATEPAAKAEQQ